MGTNNKIEFPLLLLVRTFHILYHMMKYKVAVFLRPKFYVPLMESPSMVTEFLVAAATPRSRRTFVQSITTDSQTHDIASPVSAKSISRRKNSLIMGKMWSVFVLFNLIVENEFNVVAGCLCASLRQVVNCAAAARCLETRVLDLYQ